MSDAFLPYSKQVIDDDDIAAVTEVLRSDFLTTGPTVARFEEALCQATGAKHAIACATGSAALHLAAMVLDIDQDSIAIVPPVTFAATASCIRLCGGEVTFCDVDADTGRTTPEHIANALAQVDRHRVKAIIAVDLAGFQCEREEILNLAGDIPVIFDACHALGGKTREGGRVGDAKHGTMEIFSFHPVKTVAMGEGGAVTTNDAALAEKLRMARNHGIARTPESWVQSDMAFDQDGSPNPWYYELHHPSANYRVTDMQCALGLTQLAKLDTFAKTRRDIRAVYDRYLPQLSPLLRPVRASEGDDPVLHLYPVLIDFDGLNTTRARFMAALRNLGIGSQVHYIPLHMQPYFTQRYGTIDLPGAESYYQQTLSIPYFAGMTPDDALRVVRALAQLTGQPDPTA